MSKMNAAGHLLCAAAASRDAEQVDQLWDVVDELAGRITGDPNAGVAVHSLPRDMPSPRYCVHPTGNPDGPEFRDDSLREALLQAGLWAITQLPEGELWAREP